MTGPGLVPVVLVPYVRGVVASWEGVLRYPGDVLGLADLVETSERRNEYDLERDRINVRSPNVPEGGDPLRYVQVVLLHEWAHRIDTKENEEADPRDSHRRSWRDHLRRLTREFHAAGQIGGWACSQCYRDTVAFAQDDFIQLTGDLVRARELEAEWQAEGPPCPTCARTLPEPG